MSTLATSSGRPPIRQQPNRILLRSAEVELAIVPELGAKIVSLKNLCTGREWMWSRDSSRALYPSRFGSNFADSSLVGWDECLPTIAACQWNGRSLPDHGEVWSTPWRLEASTETSVTTVVDLSLSPLTFKRTITLSGNEVRADYVLRSRSANPEPFLWAMHPLLAIESGDRLHLSPALQAKIAKEPWVESLNFDASAPACRKSFAAVPSDAAASIEKPVSASVVNLQTGDALRIEWDARENDTLGLWLTRGGWNRHHHLAIEPTNAANDSLTDAFVSRHCGLLAPLSTISWKVRIRLEPSTIPPT